MRPTRPSVVQDIADTPDDARAGGIHQVESLVGGLCLVEFHPVFPAPDRALPALRAAARRAAGSRGLVIDLRRCFGGDTDTAALIHGWLLGPTPIHLGRFEHRGHPSTDYVSDPDVGAHYGAPVRVLTSAGTFSGGEDIAYVQQALGRARVVGEQTCGGAHPVEHFSLPGDHSCQIPVARSVIEATGGNWEGIGVTPDTVCPADRALDHARRELADLDAVPPRHATITETAPTAVPARSRPEW
ncbi:S41 family peptidase [Tersicoccus sp. Bi-70]|uniref:S41 family peptidase n=1 Tax=Tersicoccus sp. Bi-70 TaxID=1897634 RepID=UPI002100F4CA|nr:S41 family peptidase [Tersicoccus sp. Bi-70]